MIPASLQFTRHQPVLRFHGIKLSPCTVGFITSSLQRQLEGVPLLVVCRLRVFAYFDCGFDSRRTYRLQHTVDHGSIQTQAANCQASSRTTISSIPMTDVSRHPASVATV